MKYGIPGNCQNLKTFALIAIYTLSMAGCKSNCEKNNSGKIRFYAEREGYFIVQVSDSPYNSNKYKQYVVENVPALNFNTPEAMDDLPAQVHEVFVAYWQYGPYQSPDSTFSFTTRVIPCATTDVVFKK